MDDHHAIDAPLRRAFTDGCTLDGAELANRLGEIDRVIEWALVDRRDDADGMELSFDRGAAAAVRDLVRRERECCGHLELAVEETDENILVAIRTRPASANACACPMCGV
jgi:hypothetical protein